VRRDADGRVRYLDAYFDDWAIVVEVDGAHHMEVQQWWHDMQRHNALSVGGEVLLRFPAFLVRDCPAEVAAVLRDALLKAGWRA
jgi:very-short-patch-repair endonuclease